MKHKICNLCKSISIKILFEVKDRKFDMPGIFIVKKCNTCGLVFVDPQPSQTILKKHYPSKQYYSYQDGKKNFFNKLRTYLIKHYYSPTLLSKIFSAVIKKVPAMPTKKKGKILDIGCGTGDTMVLLQELGWEVFGLEIDKNAIAVARERNLQNVKLGTYEQMDSYADNYFDVIRLYHVIEHLSNPGFCLELVYKKLKPGGELILGTPNVQSITSILFGKFWCNLDIPRHLFLFSPKILSRYVTQERFSQVRVEFCSAGGIIESISHVISHVRRKKLAAEKLIWLYFLIYPFEWMFDKLDMGDIFILRARKDVK